MSKRLLIPAAALALVVIIALGWYLASPLFVNDVVDEAFPVATATEPAGINQMEEADAQATAAAMPDTVMSDEMPAAAPEPVLSGSFQDADDFHQGAGSATIYALEDGSYVLRFEDFSVTNGPDLHVYLTSHPNPTSQADVMQDAIDLGSLKGNVGSQNYQLPAGTDISQFSTIVIYCQPFHVIFATASLA